MRKLKRNSRVSLKSKRTSLKRVIDRLGSCKKSLKKVEKVGEKLESLTPEEETELEEKILERIIPTTKT